LPPQEDAAAFWAEISKFDRSVTATTTTLTELDKKVGLLAIAVQRTQGGDPTELDNTWQIIQNEVNALNEILNGNEARNELFERTQPTVRSRLRVIFTGLGNSTYGPTQTHRDQFGYAQEDFDQLRSRLKALVETTIPAFERELLSVGAPWVPGGEIP